VFELTHSREAKKEPQMAKTKKRKQQQSCKVMQMIKKIEKAASTAKKIYQAVEPVVKTILEYRRKTK
jgi:predicted GTPase